MVYRRYSIVTHLLNDVYELDKEFDTAIAKALLSLGGALVVRTRAAMPRFVPEAGGWFVSMQAFPNRSAYLRLLSLPEFADAFEKVRNHFSEASSLAMAEVIDNRQDPAQDCAWKPWGFNQNEPLPYTAKGFLGKLINFALTGSSDDGYPLQVWNVDGYQPGAARSAGGTPLYVDGAIQASWRMGMIHSIVMACPEVVCDSLVLDGEALEGINGFMLIQYASARTLARMVNDPAFGTSPKKDTRVFTKNMDVPARVLNDALAIVPSPLAKLQHQVPTDCQDPAWQRARKAEEGIDSRANPCDIDKFKAGMEECAPAALEGHCGKTGVCKYWMLHTLQACAGALTMFNAEVFAQPHPAGTPHGMMFTGGLYHRALESGAVKTCAGRTEADKPEGSRGINTHTLENTEL